MKRLLKTLLAIALTITVVVPALLYFLQEKLLFHSQAIDPAATFDFPGTWEERWVTAPDGKRQHALYFEAPNAQQTVLYFHGNAGNLAGWGHLAPTFTQRGYNVLLVDYRGFGKSEGSISNERQLINDASSFYRALADSIGEENIVLYGRSLGSGIATQVAAANSPAKLLLETPYYSMEYVAGQHMSWAPVGLVLKYKLKTNEHLPKVQCPVFAIHGTSDEVIPVNNAELLAAEHSPLQLTIVKNGMHNNLEQFRDYHEWLNQALAAR